MNKMMESIVICPKCGKEVKVLLEGEKGIANFMNDVFGTKGAKIENFYAHSLCVCGANVIVALTVTAR